MSTRGNGSQQQERLAQSQSVHCLYSNMGKGAKSVEKLWDYKNQKCEMRPECLKRIAQHNAHLKGAQLQVLKYKMEAMREEKQESVSSAKSLQWLAELRSAAELGVGITASRTRVKSLGCC